MALQDSPDLFFNGQRDPSHAFMCGKGDEVDLTTPPHFTLIAVVVERSLLNPLWERMYQKPPAHWLEKQLVLPTTDIKSQNLRDVLGTTPIKYLRSLRLNSVRRALRQAAPGETIQDIASHWGFWHLSQFAQDYKHLFGELPSATLRSK